MVRSLGDIHTTIREALTMNTASGEYVPAHEGTQRAVAEARMRFRQFGSIARIAVAPSVRTVLTRLGEAWNSSTSDTDQGIVARWGWLVITDIGRNDLFGEPREISDEFVGDVDVRLP